MVLFWAQLSLSNFRGTPTYTNSNSATGTMIGGRAQETVTIPINSINRVRNRRVQQGQNSSPCGRYFCFCHCFCSSGSCTFFCCVFSIIKKTRIKGTSATVGLIPKNTSFGFLKPRRFPGTVDLYHCFIDQLEFQELI